MRELGQLGAPLCTRLGGRSGPCAPDRATVLSVAVDWPSLPSLLAFVLLCTLAGCGTDTTSLNDPDADGPPPRLTAKRSAENGPVRLTVEVDPAVARLSDEPTMTVTIDYERGVTIEKPPFGESVGDFIIRDFREPLPQAVGNREKITQIYTLEPTRMGELTVWPVAVRFTDNRTDGNSQPQTVETEGLTITVKSMLETETPSLADLEAAAGPQPLPAPRSYALWWLAGILIALAAAGGVVWFVRARRRRAELFRSPTPQELARLELKRLLRARLAERDVKLFYVRLTAVVRRYIERTTGIQAAEQTTEEFLRAMGTQRSCFSPSDSRKLQEFLESADLVKFARHQPQHDDVNASIQRARAFIGISWSPEQAA
jgi:hypothetical protein